MMATKIRATSYKLCYFELSLVICQNPLGYVEHVYYAL
jgi:hypothetical protein